jgi:hypothetical protein
VYHIYGARIPHGNFQALPLLKSLIEKYLKRMWRALNYLVFGMASSHPMAPQLPSKHITMGYLAEIDLYKTKKPFFSNVPFFHIPGAKQHNIGTEYHDGVQVFDLRGHESDVTLDTHGFEIHMLVS